MDVMFTVLRNRPYKVRSWEKEERSRNKNPSHDDTTLTYFFFLHVAELQAHIRTHNQFPVSICHPPCPSLCPCPCLSDLYSRLARPSSHHHLLGSRSPFAQCWRAGWLVRGRWRGAAAGRSWRNGCEGTLGDHSQFTQKT